MLELVFGNLLLASLIAAIAICVGRGGRRAALAHALWVLVFVKLITPPIISLPVPIPFPSQTAGIANPSQSDIKIARSDSEPNATRVHESEIANKDSAGDHLNNESDIQLAANLPLGTDVISTAPTSIAEYLWEFGSRASNWIIGIWAIGFLVIACRSLLRLIRFRRLIAQCGRDDEDAADIVRQFSCGRLTSRWGTSPRVIRIDVHVSPMLFGFATRPMIVCPEDLWQAMSDDDRRAFLAHETAHYCRRDHWVRWLEWIVSSAYWWFPGIYFAQRQLERHEEACCDRRAVELLETKPRRYAEALLRVVDFISDHQIGLPGFASGMQPTATLEERLRLLMRQESNMPASRGLRLASGVVCSAMIVVHPQLYAMPLNERQNVSRRWTIASPSFEDAIETTAASNADPIVEEADLPPAPSGFWNLKPQRRWASFTLQTSGYHLRAISGRGISINGNRTRLTFSEDQLTAISEISSTGRVIIGDRQGKIRMWDLEAAMAVSLLGSHQSEVTSVCVGTDGGVFSSDSAGSVIRWEMQSGQMIGRWTSDGVPIQSIRLSDDGMFLAVVCGDWKMRGEIPTLHLLNTQTLSHQGQQTLPQDAALVQQDEQHRWCIVHWDGSITDLFSGSPLGAIDKVRVSALLLSQHAKFDVAEPTADN
ncbi:M56 family metallopeptidase [Stieleria sp. JC731]|uniref:M56 family metallopeptidase n=1 Tax=Stieleria sp. JC731 TaxID=2894195 RepID=UPI001E442402|nr:M56 family metallopeptidase [Stieleria sp. JC731]